MAGEEVGAVVVEMGASGVRFGHAGEDAPRCMPSALGSHRHNDTRTFSRRLVPHAQVCMPLRNGHVQDWDAFDYLLGNVYQQLRVDMNTVPLLLTDAAHAHAHAHPTHEHRAKLAELAFENHQVPAFYLARQSVMAAFAAGRSTALVVDLGADSTSVTPVYEGYALKKGVLSQPLAGNYLSRHILHHLHHHHHSPLVPQYRVLTRKLVEAGKPAEPTLKSFDTVTDSYNDYALMQLADEFKHCVCAVSETRYNENALAMRPQKSFEFPDGYNTNFGIERYRIPEILFQPQQLAPSLPPTATTTTDPASLLGLTQMIHNSLSTCEQDSRAQMLANLVITGGTSLLPNLPERLNAELAQLIPGLRIKLHASGSSIERRYGSWIGGSILASLGTFHQLWVSKAEYEEHGASLLEKRCH